MYKRSINFLKDDFSNGGMDYVDFKDMVTVMDDRTHILQVRAGDIQLFHMLHDYQNNEKYVSCYQSNTTDLTGYEETEKDFFGSLLGKKNHYMGFPKEWLKSESLREEDFEEIFDENKNISLRTVIKVGDEVFFVSKSFIPALAQQLGIGGDLLLYPSVERNEFLAYGLKLCEKKKLKLTYREEYGVKKLFDVRTDRYAGIPQSTIARVVDSLDKSGMGKPVCVNWMVDHERTRIYLEFPEQAVDFSKTLGKEEILIPGLWVTTSDLGQNALTVYGTWNMDNSVSLHETVSRKHCGEFKLDDFLWKIERNIFEEYLHFPEKLIELAGKDITRMGASAEINECRVTNAVRLASNQCELARKIGKKKEEEIRQIIVDEIDVDMPVTAYDIAISFLELPKRVSVSIDNKEFNETLASAVKNVVYTKFDNIKESASGEYGQLNLVFD